MKQILKVLFLSLFFVNFLFAEEGKKETKKKEKPVPVSEIRLSLSFNFSSSLDIERETISDNNSNFETYNPKLKDSNISLSISSLAPISKYSSLKAGLGIDYEKAFALSYGDYYYNYYSDSYSYSEYSRTSFKGFLLPCYLNFAKVLSKEFFLIARFGAVFPFLEEDFLMDFYFEDDDKEYGKVEQSFGLYYAYGISCNINSFFGELLYTNSKFNLKTKYHNEDISQSKTDDYSSYSKINLSIGYRMF